MTIDSRLKGPILPAKELDKMCLLGVHEYKLGLLDFMKTHDSWLGQPLGDQLNYINSYINARRWYEHNKNSTSHKYISSIY